MRREFPKAVKVARWKIATRDGVTYCEECGLPAKRWHFDHVIADGLNGEPTLENCRLLCLPCHGEKTKDDVPAIARAKRLEANNAGAKLVPTRKIQSAGFVKREKRGRIELAPLPRRPIYQDE